MVSIDFRRMFYSLPAPYMVLDTDLRFIDMNARYLATTDRSREELLGRYVFEAFPETGERLAMFKDAFERAVRGEANELIKKPFSIPRPESQGGGMKEVWWTCHHVPIYDIDGKVCGMVQNAEDVTAEVDAERMRDVISHEFDHRVKNLLTTISTIARRTSKSAPSTDAFIGDFDARISALARTHQLLFEGGWEGLTLRELLDGELEPYRQTEGLKIEIGGPPVELSSRQAQSLGMAFHELATNAAKYGALGHPNGVLKVTWSIDRHSSDIVLVWTEDGLEGVKAPTVQGFGTTILERVMPVELSGSVTRQFLPTGLCCTIVLPQVQTSEPLQAAG